MCLREVEVLQEEVSDVESTCNTTRGTSIPCVVHEGAHSGEEMVAAAPSAGKGEVLRFSPRRRKGSESS